MDMISPIRAWSSTFMIFHESHNRQRAAQNESRAIHTGCALAFTAQKSHKESRGLDLKKKELNTVLKTWCSWCETLKSIKMSIYRMVKISQVEYKNLFCVNVPQALLYLRQMDSELNAARTGSITLSYSEMPLARCMDSLNKHTPVLQSRALYI